MAPVDVSQSPSVFCPRMALRSLYPPLTTAHNFPSFALNGAKRPSFANPAYARMERRRPAGMANGRVLYWTPSGRSRCPDGRSLRSWRRRVRRWPQGCHALSCEPTSFCLLHNIRGAIKALLSHHCVCLFSIQWHHRVVDIRNRPHAGFEVDFFRHGELERILWLARATGIQAVVVCKKLVVDDGLGTNDVVVVDVGPNQVQDLKAGS